MSLDDARRKCEAWRRHYNEERPHSAIGNKPRLSLSIDQRRTACPERMRLEKLQLAGPRMGSGSQESSAITAGDCQSS